MIKVLATAVAAVAISLTACQPPPPPVEPDWVARGCDWIAESEYLKVREGMTLEQVEGTLGKELDLLWSYTINLYEAPSVTRSTYSWEQTWEENGCYQWTSFYFEDGVHTGDSSWGKVTK